MNSLFIIFGYGACLFALRLLGLGWDFAALVGGGVQEVVLFNLAAHGYISGFFLLALGKELTRESLK